MNSFYYIKLSSAEVFKLDDFPKWFLCALLFTLSVIVSAIINSSLENRNDVRDRFVSHYISLKEIRKL